MYSTSAIVTLLCPLPFTLSLEPTPGWDLLHFFCTFKRILIVQGFCSGISLRIYCTLLSFTPHLLFATLLCYHSAVCRAPHWTVCIHRYSELQYCSLPFSFLSCFPVSGSHRPTYIMFSLSLCVYLCIYMHTLMYIRSYIYVYIYL
jgi:hypothetical protein